jgi:hypothetical protein
MTELRFNGEKQMDTGTELAIRAVIRGLFHTDAISADQVRGVSPTRCKRNRPNRDRCHMPCPN